MLPTLDQWLDGLVSGGSGSLLLLGLLDMQLRLLLLRKVCLLAGALVILEEHLRPVVLVEET